MKNIFFEVQLCIKISIFKEKHVFDILIILCLMTSLSKNGCCLGNRYLTTQLGLTKCSMRYDANLHCLFEVHETFVCKASKQPKKSAAFGGRLLVLFWGLKYSQLLEVQNKIYTY